MIDIVQARSAHAIGAPRAPKADARPLALLVTHARPREQAIRATLERAGFVVVPLRDPARAAREAALRRPSVIVLDGAAFEQDGLASLAHFRRVVRYSPLLLVTPAAVELVTIAALRAGADAVVAATIAWPELAARALALARRAWWQRREEPELLRFGDVEIDPAGCVVRRAGAPVELSPKELALLVALVRRAPCVVSRDELLREVWGYREGVVTRTVDTHVRLLRRKLERDPGEPRHILTAQRTGYRIVP